MASDDEINFPFLFVVPPVQRPPGRRAVVQRPAQHAFDLIRRVYDNPAVNVAKLIYEQEMMFFFKYRLIEAGRPQREGFGAVGIAIQLGAAGIECYLYPRLICYKTGYDLAKVLFECQNAGVFYHHMCATFPFCVGDGIIPFFKKTLHMAKQNFHQELSRKYKNQRKQSDASRIQQVQNLVRTYKKSLAGTRMVAIIVEEKPEIIDDKVYGDGSVHQYWVVKIWAEDKQTDPSYFSADAPKPSGTCEPSNHENYAIEVHMQLIDPTGVMQDSECRMGTWLHNCLGGYLHQTIKPGEFGVPLPDPNLDTVFNAYRVLVALLDNPWVDSSSLPSIGPLPVRVYQDPEFQYRDNMGDMEHACYYRGRGYEQLLIEKQFYTLDMQDIKWKREGVEDFLSGVVPNYKKKSQISEKNSQQTKESNMQTSKGKKTDKSCNPQQGSSNQSTGTPGPVNAPQSNVPVYVAPQSSLQTGHAIPGTSTAGTNTIFPGQSQGHPTFVCTNYPNDPVNYDQVHLPVNSPNFGQIGNQQPLPNSLMLPTDGQILFRSGPTTINWDTANTGCRVFQNGQEIMQSGTSAGRLPQEMFEFAGVQEPPSQQAPPKRSRRGESEMLGNVVLPTPPQGGRTLRSRTQRNAMDRERLAREDPSCMPPN